MSKHAASHFILLMPCFATASSITPVVVVAAAAVVLVLVLVLVLVVLVVAVLVVAVVVLVLVVVAAVVLLLLFLVSCCCSMTSLTEESIKSTMASLSPSKDECKQALRSLQVLHDFDLCQLLFHQCFSLPKHS